MGKQADVTREPSLLNCNSEYVLYRIAIIRSDPTFSSENFASLGYPVLKNIGRIGLLWKEQNVAD